MRILVRYKTCYTYERAPKSITQILRMTPRAHEGQHVVSWRIDCDADCRLRSGEDAYGNITHAFTVASPVHTLSLVVEGDIETFDTHGVIGNAVERFPPVLFLRETRLTAPCAALRGLGAESRSSLALDRLHDLMTRINSHMVFDSDPTHAGTSASEAWSLGRGVCQDYAHIFIAAARGMGIPARYVSGHLFRKDGVIAQDAGHAWAEAYIESLGWVGFDAANGVCTDESHVRIAIGLDYLDAAPVRGSHTAGSGERLHVEVAVSEAFSQCQN